MRGADPRVVLGLHRSRHERGLLKEALELGVTALDTSANYLGFRSHETLAKVAGDLLAEFTISTKVGFFPGGEHSLDPVRLLQAVERTVRDLGREPDVVLLHNPEHTLGSAPDAHAVLAQACGVLVDATAQGLCQGWGISVWDTTALAGIGDVPRPDVLMVRAGLFVGVGDLEASERLMKRWRPVSVWGMSPFGGVRGAGGWGEFDPLVFLRDGQGSQQQAAFRAAFHLPAVDAMAVGTDAPEHLRELTEALEFTVDGGVVKEYRQLLRALRQPV
ncbi:aldo/keto reductase [Streptomyces sp. NPDC048680]|uniref:aldo/keto reductase n=1 Tax=Streptomyces sp. NPDC048680 TaxID=3155492 RepID=UPI00342ED91C